jgi:hypothetical protein
MLRCRVHHREQQLARLALNAGALARPQKASQSMGEDSDCFSWNSPAFSSG